MRKEIVFPSGRRVAIPHVGLIADAPKISGESHGLHPCADLSAGEGLGDAIERHLHAWGITVDRYQQIKSLFGLAPECGCAKRKAWLNAVGRWWKSNATPQ